MLGRLLLGLLLLWPAAAGAETMLLDARALQALDPQGQVSLAAALPDGTLLLVDEPGRGASCRLLLVDPEVGRPAAALELPFASPEHLRVNGEGTQLLAWSPFGSELWSVELPAGRAALVSRRQPGQRSFGLYPGLSRIFPYDGGFAAWGYFLGPDGKFEGDALVRVRGQSLETLLTLPDIRRLAREAFPRGKAVGQVEVAGDYLAAVVRSDQALEGLMVVRLSDRRLLFARPLRNFSGMALAPPLLVLAGGSGKETELSLVELPSGASRSLASGPFGNPVLSADGSRVAVLSIDGSSGAGLRQSLQIFPLFEGGRRESYSLSNGRLYVDHRFRPDGSLLLFDGQALYVAP
ncbi:MAG TPA: hypothetical protein VNO81_12400 [Candidatus Nitrosotenuis sp.]|nr:hypothetical protein [Candidatus Nitrosotenuis sp.]